ncbi:unnamed protein product [Owenia fusiformis]|uniref:VWFD domain-containing protein n=1 Tax=Owenia fusiformis TaxID=6347 RepID=A0A8S4PNJ1_OWEFU|nr:unnamed protein product [Owenia fusiformis]
MHAQAYNRVLAKCVAYKCYQTTHWYMLPYDSESKKAECLESGYMVCSLYWPPGMNKYKYLQKLILDMVKKSNFGQFYGYYKQVTTLVGRNKVSKSISRNYKAVQRELKHQLQETTGKLMVKNLKKIKKTVKAFVNGFKKILNLFDTYEHLLIESIQLTHQYLAEYGKKYGCDKCIETDVFCANDFCPPVKSGENCENSIQGNDECVLIGRKENPHYVTAQIYSVETFDGAKTTKANKGFNQDKSFEFELLGPHGKPLIGLSLRSGWLKSLRSVKGHVLTLFNVHSNIENSCTCEVVFMGNIVEGNGKPLTVPGNYSIESVLYLDRMDIYQEEGDTHIFFPQYGLKISPMANEGLKIVLNRYWQGMTRRDCGNFDGNSENDKNENGMQMN